MQSRNVMSHLLAAVACPLVAACSDASTNPEATMREIDRSAARLANPDCEKHRGAMKERAQKLRSNGSSGVHIAGEWRCMPEGAGSIDVATLSQSGQSVNGTFLSWESPERFARGLSPEYTYSVAGAVEGSELVLYTPEQDTGRALSGSLKVTGTKLTGEWMIRSNTACRAVRYACVLSGSH